MCVIQRAKFTLLSISFNACSPRLGSLLVLSIVLVSPVEEGVQGIIAVLAVLSFVFGFALGLGAGTSFNYTVACVSFL